MSHKLYHYLFQAVETSDIKYAGDQKSGQLKNPIFMEADKRGKSVKRHQKLDNDKQTMSRLTTMEVKDIDEELSE